MTKQRKTRSPHPTSHELSHALLKRLTEGSFIIAMTATLFIWLSLVSYHSSDTLINHVGLASSKIDNAGGQVGAYIADIGYFLFGYVAYGLPLCFAYLAWCILKDHRAAKKIIKSMLLLRIIGIVLLLLGSCGLFDLQIQGSAVGYLVSAGGIVGQYFASTLSKAFNPPGTTLLFMAMSLVGSTWLTGLSWLKVVELIGYYTHFLLNYSYRQVRGLWSMLARYQQQVTASPKPNKLNFVRPMIDAVVLNTPRDVSIPEPKVIETRVVEARSEPKPKCDPPKAKSVPTTVWPHDHKPAVLQGLPDLSLLAKAQPGKPLGGYTHQQLELLSRDVEQHLLDFGIQVDVVSVHPGPVITRFELQLAAGVKASRLTALARDLARSLSVSSVRVVEIIPGKTVVGIELPNQNRAMVSLAEVLSADVYQQAPSALTLALGVDIAGYPMVVDLAKMPHLLVAGTTGSGKSVGINAMILSLLYKATPEHVRLIMIDPKMLELSVYEGIPHLLTPVVTDMKEAQSALRWCVAEMDRRYRLMAAVGVRNLAGYNAKITEAAAKGDSLIDPLWRPTDSSEQQAPMLSTLPYIVVVIDELADMMMVVGKKVEQLIARIAQKARAAGIHLILATQRPSVDVLTGLIKSNIPTRISFQVSSKIDSRTILDQQGAEQLLGYGDMLFLAPGTGAPLRVHGAFVDDQEVHRVADDWRLRGQPNYLDEITQYVTDGDGFGNEGSEDTEDADPLYDEAVEFVLQTRKASISSVQRRFKIGYNRAARLVEEMERVGVVGPLEGGMRDVLVSAGEREA